MEELEAWLTDYCEKIKPYIQDTGVYLRDAQAAGKKILFEAQLGALRDIDFGIYPYTSSSSTIAAYAPIGQCEDRKHRRRCEGLFQLRRRRPLHLRDVR